MEHKASEVGMDRLCRNQWRHIIPRSALVGLFSGLITALFGWVLSSLDMLRGDLLIWAHQMPSLGWLVPVVLALAGAVLSLFLVRRFAPETAGGGVAAIKEVLDHSRTLRWGRVLPVKLLAASAALGSGLVLGRAGPVVQMGGAIGEAVSEKLKMPADERRAMIASGAGACLAAMFNVPLSGFVFVLEELLGEMQPVAFASVLLAAIVADITVGLLRGTSTAFIVPDYASLSLSALPVAGLLGLAAGLLGAAFNRSLIVGLNLSARLKSGRFTAVLVVIAALVGLTGWFLPELAGGGHDLNQLALAGEIAFSVLPLMLLLRFGLTVGCFGLGAAGGIFAPLLVIGALLGLGVGQAANALFPALVPEPGVFAVLGMAAMFTAVVRTPVTGVLLMVEMTGNFSQILPLLVCCSLAYYLADRMGSVPAYEALMQRDLHLHQS